MGRVHRNWAKFGGRLFSRDRAYVRTKLHRSATQRRAAEKGTTAPHGTARRCAAGLYIAGLGRAGGAFSVTQRCAMYKLGIVAVTSTGTWCDSSNNTDMYERVSYTVRHATRQNMAQHRTAVSHPAAGAATHGTGRRCGAELALWCAAEPSVVDEPS